jgi:O-antigen ligase
MNRDSSFRENRYVKYVLSVSLLLYAFFLPVSQSATYFPLALLCACALFARVSTEGKFPPFSSLRFLFVIFCLIILWNYLTLGINGREISHKPLFRAFIYLPVFLIADFPAKGKWKNDIAANSLFTISIVTGIIIVLGIYQGISGITYPFPRQIYHDGRLFGFFGHHILAGGFFSSLAVICLCLVLFWETSRKKRLVLIWCLLMLITGMLLSLSRTYYVSLFFTLPLILLKKNLKTAKYGMILALLSVAVILMMSEPPLI